MGSKTFSKPKSKRLMLMNFERDQKCCIKAFLLATLIKKVWLLASKKTEEFLPKYKLA